MKVTVPDQLTFSLERRPDGNFDLDYSESFDLEKRGMTEKAWKRMADATMNIGAILFGVSGNRARLWKEGHTVHFRLENIEREELARMIVAEILAEEKEL